MNEDFNIGLGRRLLYMRKRLQIPQKEFADVMGVPVADLASMEDGKLEPRMDSMMAVSEHYKLDMNYIITGMGSMFKHGEDESDEEILERMETINTIDELVWLMKRSPMFYNFVMGLGVKFFYENKSLILKNIRNTRLKKGGKH